MRDYEFRDLGIIGILSIVTSVSVIPQFLNTLIPKSQISRHLKHLILQEGGKRFAPNQVVIAFTGLDNIETVAMDHNLGDPRARTIV